jgi:hypothetical protein
MLMRQGEKTAELIPEQPLPLEKDLHDVLTRHPTLLPAEDLGLGRVVVAGRESGLTSGRADLVLIDDRGQLCLVEVKKAGNQDTRQVVAQLLDYAAAIWGQSLAEFEASLVAPYLATLTEVGAPTTLAELVTSAFEDQQSDGDQAQTEAVLDRLAQTLITGDFVLVLAAPDIPLGVQRVLEYLNARGQRMYALEVSFFKGPAECFVPRLVVKPSSAVAAPPSTPIAAEDFTASLPPQVQGAVETFLSDAQAAGAVIEWKASGPSVRVVRDTSRQVAWLQARTMGATVQASGGFPTEPFARVAERLVALGIGQAGGWYHTVQWSNITSAQAEEALGVVLDGILELVPHPDWTEIDPPVSISFERNDHNLWSKSVPALEQLQGRRLRGQIRELGGSWSAVELLALKGGSPGWRPHFPAGNNVEAWPPGVSGRSYELRVDAVA